MVPGLTALQVTEAGHLKTMHEKYQEGYSGYYWLKAAPIPDIQALIKKCELSAAVDTITNHSLLTDLSLQLKKLLNNKIAPEKIAETVSKALYGTAPVKGNERDIFKKAEAVLAQYAMFSEIKEPSLEFSLKDLLATVSSSGEIELTKDVSTYTRETDLSLKVMLNQRLERMSKFLSKLKAEEIAISAFDTEVSSTVTFINEVINHHLITDETVLKLFTEAATILSKFGREGGWGNTASTIVSMPTVQSTEKYRFYGASKPLTVCEKLAKELSLKETLSISFYMNEMHLGCVTVEDLNLISVKFSKKYSSCSVQSLTVLMSKADDIFKLCKETNIPVADLCLEYIPKSTHFEYDSDLGIIKRFSNLIEAELIYHAIPDNCKPFIQLDPHSNSIIILNKSGGSRGIFSAQDSKIGMEWPDNTSRDLCCKLLNINSQHCNVFFGQKGPTRDNSNMVYVAPEFFYKYHKPCVIM